MQKSSRRQRGDRSRQVAQGIPGSWQGHRYPLPFLEDSRLHNTWNRCHPTVPGLSECWRVAARGLQEEREEEGWAHMPCLLSPAHTLEGPCRMGLGGVGDLPKISPLVTWPPVVASVTLGVTGSGWQCWLRQQRHLPWDCASGQVWCPFYPVSQLLNPFELPPSAVWSVIPQSCRDSGSWDTGHSFGTLVFSHLGRWQGPLGGIEDNVRVQLCGPSGK